MKIYFDTIGCRLNQAEIEKMAAEFRAGGHEIAESPENADLVIINSCAVTAAAASDSRQKVRQTNKAGNQNILLTGCWATLSPHEALELPGVTSVVNNNEKDQIPLRIMGRLAPNFDLEPLERKPLPGAHKRTRAFIKVQDGCDNQCTFCITRVARGRSRSLTESEILDQVRIAENGNSHEIVLSGVNLGSWGRDRGQGETLFNLLEKILLNTQIERVRLSSIEPWDIDDHFLDLWQDRRMCRHLHIPLQSGCVDTLKRMARRTTPDKFRRLLSQIKTRIPEMAITTDVIVGFSGETEDAFQESLAFIQEMEFAGGHVFRFSPRMGTPAFDLPGRVNGRIAHQRSEEIRIALRKSESNYWQKFIGREVLVLWESSTQSDDGRWILHGLTDNYLPVSTISSENRWNQMDSVKLTTPNENFIISELVV